jgi:DNA repair exonuclease SbcCD ATPase subunit
MYEHHHSHDFNPFAQPEVQVQPAELTTTDEAGREADPYDVINFLLKKVDDQQTRLTEHEGFMELQNQELEQLKAQLEASKQELDAAKREIETHAADYDVLMQNTLAVERELESYKAKSTERPKISLPFHTEQKLAKLGFTPDAVEERQAV